MSKSVGNVIDPQEVIKRFGAEAFRAWVFLEGDITEGDVKYSYARTEGSGKFLTKLWNISRLISSFPEGPSTAVTPSEEWMIAELSSVIAKTRANYEDYAFSKAALDLRYFTWNVFADHYVEMVKGRAYGGPGVTRQEQEAAWNGLHTGLKNILLLMAPLMPFITDYLWRKLYGSNSVHSQSFPTLESKSDYVGLTQQLLDFDSTIWNAKKSQGLSLKDPTTTPVPTQLKPFEPDLRRMHHIQ
jgi:valyl-tRNA synthetase